MKNLKFLLIVAVVYVVADWIDTKKELHYVKGYVEGMTTILHVWNETDSKKEA